MYDCLKKEFKRFEGQPVKIYTDDGRIHMGIDVEAYENAVRIIDRCGRLMLVEYCHIDAVEEPQMELSRCDCDCDGYDSAPKGGKGGDCDCGCGRARCC